MPKHDNLESLRRGKWTRAEDYLATMARRRSPPDLQIRTSPEAPRLLLSTLPFVALMTALAVLSAAIMVIAWPGSQPQPRPRTESHEQGVAAKGWLQEAARDFQR